MFVNYYKIKVHFAKDKAQSTSCSGVRSSTSAIVFGLIFPTCSVVCCPLALSISARPISIASAICPNQTATSGIIIIMLNRIITSVPRRLDFCAVMWHLINYVFVKNEYHVRSIKYLVMKKINLNYYIKIRRAFSREFVKRLCF